MLQKVQLLVGGGRPEVLALIGERFFVSLAFVVDDGDTAFLAKGRIGEHYIKAITRIADQAVTHLDRTFLTADAVQIKIHRA